MKCRKFRSLPAVLMILAAVTATTATPARAVEVAFEKDSSLPVVYLNFAIKAGSVTDPAGQSGLSNFMGEMLLRGTRARSKEQIDLALDQMGAKLEVETRAEALILRGAVLSSQLEPFLDLVSEIVTEPSFPETEIRKLKSEIVSGILEELGRDPTLANRRFTKFLFRDHPYGKPILGTVDNVQKLTRTEIAAQYEKLFQDRHLLIVGSGQALPEQIEKWARGVAAKRPDGKEGGTSGYILVNAPANAPSRRLQIVDKPDRTQTQINIGQIGVKMTDKDFFPLYLGNFAFGGPSFSAKMMVEIRVKRGWSYGANSNFRFGLQPRSWQAHLFPASKDTAQALTLSLKLIEDLRNNGITQGEFDFAKESLVNSVGFMFNTPKKRVENTLLERTLDLPDGFMKTYGPELQKVQLAEVNNSMKQYLKPANLAVSVLATASELQEALTKAAAVEPGQVEVVPYTQE